MCIRDSVTTDKDAAAETTKAETSAEAGETKAEAGDSAASDEQITLKVIDWSDSTKARREEFHKKFMEEMCIRDRSCPYRCRQTSRTGSAPESGLFSSVPASWTDARTHYNRCLPAIC